MLSCSEIRQDRASSAGYRRALTAGAGRPGSSGIIHRIAAKPLSVCSSVHSHIALHPGAAHVVRSSRSADNPCGSGCIVGPGATVWASASGPRVWARASGDGRLRLGLVTTRQCEVIVTEHRKFQTHQQSFPPSHHPVHPDAMTPEHDDLRDSIASMLPASAQSSASTSSSSNASLDDELTPFPSPMLSAKSLAGLSRMFSLGAWSTVR